MSKAKINFSKNFKAVNSLLPIYQYLAENAGNLDSSGILRAQYVLLVSAFDTYVHELILETIINRFFQKTEKLAVDYPIPMELIHGLRNASEEEQKEKLYIYLSEELKKNSFQSPKNIEAAFAILKEEHIWRRFADVMNWGSAEDVKNQLALIVQRRNKIAHESDWNQSMQTYESIDIETVEDCRDFIKDLVDAMDSLF